MSSSSSTTSGSASSASGMTGLPAGYLYETEENNRRETADIFSPSQAGFVGSIPLGDIDMYAVWAPVGSSVAITVDDGLGGCPPGVTIILRVFTWAADNSYAVGVDPGTTSTPLCARVIATPGDTTFTDGLYFIQVESAKLEPVAEYAVEAKVVTP